MDPITPRRTFLKSIAATAAASSFLNLNPRALGANDRINLALIGGRNQGKHVALRMIGQGARIATFCDIDQAILDKTSPELEKAQGVRPKHERDFRRILDDKSIDAVVIAAPDHWHTHMSLLACAAGKDCYTEKPLSQTIHEGHLIRDAARKHNRIVQVGTQRRSFDHFMSAAEYAASGKLGKICHMKAWISQLRESIGTPPDSDPPSTADYDLWLGPAPKRPFNVNRFHYNWRFFWDYGNSELGNQGVHVLDVALMALAKMKGPTQCLPRRVSATGGIYWLKDAKEVPDIQTVNFDYGDMLLTFELQSFSKSRPTEGAWAGTAFYGSEGTLVAVGDGWKVFGADGKVVTQVKDTGGSHEGNFLASMRSRQLPNADVEIGRLSTTLCHLGNISYHLRRDVTFDPATESFPHDEQATKMLTKSYRDAWPMPRV
ncbi:MAG TPA: Gfo/Idh/MocA family oxidoreductase [Bryobacteraceae bacterium]|nr:Gfo/Idh/MocA family oxidoreductase [Bryobacteraceae bacterium]